MIYDMIDINKRRYMYSGFGGDCLHCSIGVGDFFGHCSLLYAVCGYCPSGGRNWLHWLLSLLLNSHVHVHRIEYVIFIGLQMVRLHLVQELIAIIFYFLFYFLLCDLWCLFGCLVWSCNIFWFGRSLSFELQIKSAEVQCSFVSIVFGIFYQRNTDVVESLSVNQFSMTSTWNSLIQNVPYHGYLCEIWSLIYLWSITTFTHLTVNCLPMFPCDPFC